MNTNQQVMAGGYEYSGEGLLAKDSRVKCFYCGMNHWSDECQKYKTTEQRKRQINVLYAWEPTTYIDTVEATNRAFIVRKS